MDTVDGITAMPDTISPASVNATPSCDPTLLDSVAVKVIKTAAYSILLLLSLVGNSLVPAVVYRNPDLHTSINYFIASMSISDLLIPIFALTSRIKQIYVSPDIWQIDGTFGSLLCKLRAFFSDTSFIVTFLTLLTVSFERFFAIVYPFKRQPIQSRKSCFIVIVIIWTFATFYSSQNFYTWHLKTVNSKTRCIHSWASDSDQFGKLIEIIVFQFCFIIVPFVIITILYSIIIASLSRKKASEHIGRNQRSRIEKENRRVTYMLLAVVVVFLVPSTAASIYVFLNLFVWPKGQLCTSRHLEFALVYLGYICQAFNPYMYYVYNSRYRKGFKKIFCCRSRCICCSEIEREMTIRSQSNRTASLEPDMTRDVTFISMRGLQSNDLNSC